VLLHVRRSADRLLKHLREVPVSRRHRPCLQRQRPAGPEFVRARLQARLRRHRDLRPRAAIRRLATGLPLSALVLETDAPDIPPHWLYRTAAQRAAGEAQGRNEPGELPAIAAVVAGLRGIAGRTNSRATTANACRPPRLGCPDATLSAGIIAHR
jgi:TatD DNase family protein